MTHRPADCSSAPKQSLGAPDDDAGQDQTAARSISRAGPSRAERDMQLAFIGLADL